MKVNYTPPVIEVEEVCSESMLCTSVVSTGIGDFTYEEIGNIW